MHAKFGIECELINNLCLIEYENGNGDFHFHSQIEICIVNEGEIDALINNRRKRLKEGEISIALSYHTHVYKPINYSRFTVLVIPSYLCEDFILSLKSKNVVNPFICDSDAAGQIKMYINEMKKDSINNIKKIGYVYMILGIIIDNISLEPVKELTNPDLASKILFYIHENYKRNITLSSVSYALGYSPSYISKYFKAHFNIGIIRYINLVRLKDAIMLMHKEKNNITYCALESGFNSLRTFYRVFSNEFNCAPKEYFKTEI